MFDPRGCVSQAVYANGIAVCQGSLKVPKQMHAAELDYEFLLARLHWNYSRVSAEDIETIRKIVNKV